MAQARPQFHHHVALPDRSGVADGLQRVVVIEEILAPAVLGLEPMAVENVFGALTHRAPIPSA
jgi:hypothetical protein